MTEVRLPCSKLALSSPAVFRVYTGPTKKSESQNARETEEKRGKGKMENYPTRLVFILISPPVKNQVRRNGSVNIESFFLFYIKKGKG